MKIAAAVVSLLLAMTGAGAARAEEPATGSVTDVQTRGVSVRIFSVWKENAVATVVLYTGGANGYGKTGDDGWPASPNFLIRSAKLFAAHPFNVVLVGRASDVSNLDGVARTGANHDQDNQAIFRSIKAQSGVPLWLVGTSMGTVSATAAAIRDGGRSVAGLVLTSSVTSYRIPGAVPTQSLDQLRVPVLVVHHGNDACKACRPQDANNIVDRLKNAPVRKLLLLSGGSTPTGDACGPLHHHGFIGMEKETVALIATWIQHPVN